MNTNPVHPPKKPSVALLIDGENIPVSFAGQILLNASKAGNLTIKRVYGNAARITGWDAAPGIRLIHSGSIKNGADILLSIEAIDMSFTRQIDTFVIATSDQDFSHLAHGLRERGFRVVGLGEPKAPDAFRRACSVFTELRAITVSASKKLDKLDQQIHELIQISTKNEVQISQLSNLMKDKYSFKISDHDMKTWRKYLESKDKLYQCDPKGPSAKVRLAPEVT